MDQPWLRIAHYAAADPELLQCSGQQRKNDAPHVCERNSQSWKSRENIRARSDQSGHLFTCKRGESKKDDGSSCAERNRKKPERLKLPGGRKNRNCANGIGER